MKGTPIPIDQTIQLGKSEKQKEVDKILNFASAVIYILMDRKNVFHEQNTKNNY